MRIIRSGRFGSFKRLLTIKYDTVNDNLLILECLSGSVFI